MRQSNSIIVALTAILTCIGISSAIITTVYQEKGERFMDFLERMNAEPDTTIKRRLADEFFQMVRAFGRPVIEDSTVCFLYQGNARRVSVPGDLNNWTISEDTMSRAIGTDLFYLQKTVDPRARFEYKVLVDSTRILDPLNQQRVLGGYGLNSEIWMPHYAPPAEIKYTQDIPHGTLDTLSIRSISLGREHPVFVYLPPGYTNSQERFPSIYVMDGGEYITLGMMLNILDNLIAEKRIRPVVGVFIDPRTDPRNSQTSQRMHDYAMSDSFVQFLTEEVRPWLLKKYRLEKNPHQTAIMGASLGGLISTYAAFTRADVFGLCAAQSPAYSWDQEAIIHTFASSQKKPIRFYVDTGTIHDALLYARKMRRVLEEKGYELAYGEYPEGHNWANWRGRIDDILTYFWGIKE